MRLFRRGNQSACPHGGVWRRRLRLALVTLGVLVTILFGRSALHLARTAWDDRDDREILLAGFADDASRLNRTAVAEVIPVAEDVTRAEAQLTALLREAADRGLKVSIAGSRHTMGGHTIAPGGIVIDMRPFDAMQLDESADVLRVQAGATWDEIIAYLDPRGRSIEVMQSNASFTVGGSISANCHGWQPNRPPIISTVLSMRVMTADGSVVTCNRVENAELFSLVAGGYGLFGIILEADLRVVPNENYRLRRMDVETSELADTFLREVSGNDRAGLAYARVCVARGAKDFLGSAVLNIHERWLPAESPLTPTHPPSLAGVKRAVFRGSEGSDYGKTLRWNLEGWFADQLTGEVASRNQLLSDPVDLYQNRSATSTDILQEYFLPPDRLAGFIKGLGTIVERHQGDLLNVTVRHVLADHDSFLRFSDREMLGVVLLFAQPGMKAGERAMMEMTQELVDAALAGGGRHYLPYRLHATNAQMAAAYPQAEGFFKLKRKYDRQGLFQNQFLIKYDVKQPEESLAVNP